MGGSRHVRKKNGRTVCATAARAPRTSRAVATRPAAPSSFPLASVCENLADDLVALALARGDKEAGRTPEETTRAIEARVTRARASLLSNGARGVELNQRITYALASGQGRVLQTAERACVSSRPYARRAARYLVALVVGGMSEPLALVRAGSYALNQALADMLLDLAFAADPKAGITASQTSTLKDGSKLTASFATIGELVKLANAATTTARLELLTALDLQERMTQGRAPGVDPEVAARTQAILAEREKRAAAWAAAKSAEPEPAPETIDAEPADAPVLVGPTPTPPTLERLGRGERLGRQIEARPVPSPLVTPTPSPAATWLPAALAPFTRMQPWAARLASLELVPDLQKVTEVCGLVGAMQQTGLFGREEAAVVESVTRWRLAFMTTGKFPTNEGGAP